MQINLMLLSAEQYKELCRGVMVKHADSQHKGCQLDSYMCYSKNSIGEEGNGKPPHTFHVPRKDSEPCLWLLLRSKSSMQRSFLLVLDKETPFAEAESQPPPSALRRLTTKVRLSNFCYSCGYLAMISMKPETLIFTSP